MSNIISISEACAPKAVTTPSNQQESRIWSPTQVGTGTVGFDAPILSCVCVRRTDERGNYQGETPYPVIGDIQAYPAVAALLRPVEWRAAVRMDHKTGLLYYKLPSANGFSNSWLDSAKIAVYSWAGTWGRVTSDRNAGVYRFEAINMPGRAQPDIPDVDELINELLAEFVIDRLDHPILERLLNPTGASIATTATTVTPSPEADDEIY